MCSKIERKIIDSVNRITVGVFASSGIFMDGIQLWDLPCCLSIVLWLALPEFSHWVEGVVDEIKRGQKKETATYRNERLPAVC